MVNFICKVLMRLFRLLPVKRNKIFLWSFYGSQYSCNPKYISEYLLARFPGNTFDVVWAFNDPAAKGEYTGFRKVRTMSWAYFYELCTAKVIIANCRMPEWFAKRKSQYYIQTWHSSLRLKQIEKDAEDRLPPHYIRMARKDSAGCDLLLSGCEYSTQIFKRAFWYDGEIGPYGTPRNDILIHCEEQKRSRILERLGIPDGRRLVLYAPTFRKDHDGANRALDPEAVLSVLQSRFGGEWTFLVRLHPHRKPHAGDWGKMNRVTDVTAYDDVQELLSVADVLITDYSSLMFDFALTKRPCFLYAYDIDDYIRQDRKLYFTLAELPFISASGLEQLRQKIESFDEVKYRRDLERFLERIGTHETGRASESVARRIAEICFPTRSVVYEKVQGRLYDGSI